MGWFDSIIGGKSSNPANAAMPYLNQIPGQTNQYLDPFFQAGKGALNPLQENYNKLLSDPGAFMNKIGESYQQSPGFKSAMEQALMAADHAASAGGMAGTPQHRFQDQQAATDLINQHYNDWMDRALGLFNSGLSGEEGMAGRGQQAGQSMADLIAQTLAQQANMAFRGQQEKNSQRNSFLGGLGKLGGGALGALGGGLSGGPAGAIKGAFSGYNAMR